MIRKERLKKILDKKPVFKASDFKRNVVIIHSDKSIFLLRNSLISEAKSYITIYSKKHHPLIFHKKDLERWGYINNTEARKVSTATKRKTSHKSLKN